MNQHYVPKVYLRNFASKIKGENYFVDVYDKLENRFFPTNIKNICAELHLYTLDEEITKDIMAIEDIYSKIIEPMYAKAYTILSNDTVFHVSDEERAEIIIGVTQLYFRNPIILKNSLTEHKRRILNVAAEARKRNAKGLTYLDEDYSFRDFNEEQIIEEVSKNVVSFFKKNHLLGTKEMSLFHIGAVLEVATIEDESEFFASDNPFVSKDLISDFEWNPLKKSQEFILPLDKKHFLKIYHDNTKDLSKIYRYYIPDGSVALINEQIVNNCQRFVITSEKAFESYSNTKVILDDTSLEAKVDALRKLADLIKDTNDHPESKKLVLDMLEKYEKTGVWTIEEQFEFMRKSKEFYVESIQERIK